MALQNRVDPFGGLHAVEARGTLMGNRGGRFHRDDRTLGRRRHATRRWICCLTSFRGRPPRPVWGRGYTELFFLDEPTALAAGHRPCAECRRRAFRAFLSASGHASADALDRALDAERRVAPAERPRARLADLPDGIVAAAGPRAILRAGSDALAFSFAGWETADPSLLDRPLPLLTPAVAVAAIGGGFAIGSPFRRAP